MTRLIGVMVAGQCQAIRTVNYNSAQRCTALASSKDLACSAVTQFHCLPDTSTSVGRRERGYDERWTWLAKKIQRIKPEVAMVLAALSDTTSICSGLLRMSDQVGPPAGTSMLRAHQVIE